MENRESPADQIAGALLRGHTTADPDLDRGAVIPDRGGTQASSLTPGQRHNIAIASFGFVKFGPGPSSIPWDATASARSEAR